MINSLADRGTVMTRSVSGDSEWLVRTHLWLVASFVLASLGSAFLF